MQTEQGTRTVLVTGTSTGIGRATALLLDKLGYQVFASVRKLQDGEELCKKASGKLTPILLDVTNERSILRAKAQIDRAVGERGLWGLVNNAGISLRAPLELIPMDQFRRVYESNVFGLLAVTQAFLPLLRQARGRIVNIGSIAALMVTPFHGTYSSAKLAVHGITNALRLEVKPFGVQVSLIIYGGVQTAIWDSTLRRTQEISSHLPPEFETLYAERQRKALEFFFTRGRKGLLPEKAAEPILHALTAKHPRRTYFPGNDAKFYGLLDKILHGRLRDWITLQSLGLND